MSAQINLIGFNEAAELPMSFYDRMSIMQNIHGSIPYSVEVATYHPRVGWTVLLRTSKGDVCVVNRHSVDDMADDLYQRMRGC